MRRSAEGVGPPAIRALLFQVRHASDSRPPSLVNTIAQWWTEESSRNGQVRTARKFLATMLEFVRESTPERQRQRYGDADFDWDYRVDTTGATVSARNRLLGLFHSPYQPTEPSLFREMMNAVATLNLDFRKFTFIDIGSGKGRALLMAAEYPFRRIAGVELLPELHRVAQENIGKYSADSQKGFAIETVCGDARAYQFPPDPILLYLFNPLPEAALRQLLANLEISLHQSPRAVCVLYHNPLLEHVLADSSFLHKVRGTHQYSIFVA